MRLYRRVSFALGFAFLLVAAGARAEHADDPSKRQTEAIDVQVRDGLLTLNTDGIPLGAVVRAIGEKADFETVIEGTVDRPVRRSFTAVPLMTGLRYLLDGVSNVMFFAPLEKGEKKRRLLEVRLYGWDKGTPPAVSVATDPDALANLFSGERDARIRAIRKLAQAGHPQAVPALARVLREDSDAGVRGHAARALGEIGAVAAVPALQAALEDAEEGVRIRAIRGLAKLDTAEATRLLGGVLLDGSQRRSRLMAAWALGHQGGPLAASYLEAALEDPDDLVQARANRALSAIQGAAKGPDSTKPHTR